MKRILIFSALVAILSLNAYPQYSTPGTGVIWDLDDLISNSNGVVAEDNGVYFINDDLNIVYPDTIRLLTNSIIKFEGDVLVTVSGVFEASPPDSIVFTAIDTLNTFKSFRFEDSDASSFHKCIIEYGGGIDILNSDMEFTDCIFRRNDKSNSTGVIDLFFSNPSVIDCEFYYNEGPAVLSGANTESSPLIQGNMIYRNNTANSNMPQINLGTSSPDQAIQIRLNTIEGFYDKAGGIAITTLAGGSLDCIIDSNLIFNNRYGITAYGFDITSVISNNSIYDNNIENLPMMGGSGINYWGGTSNTSLVYGNEIYGNLWGITVTGDALPNFGQVVPDTINAGENIFYDNGNQGVTYALYNNTPNDIYAENNYWGTYDLDSAEMVIFHQTDDETLGFVDYMPIMDSLVTSIPQYKPDIGIRLCPNPAGNEVTLYLEDLYDTESDLLVVIRNTEGQKVRDIELQTSSIKIDLAGLKPGLYFVELFIRGYCVTSKFIKY